MKTTNVKIVIVGTGTVWNGSIMYKDRKVGHAQLNFGDCPKRVGNLIRALRKIGVIVDVPKY